MAAQWMGMVDPNPDQVKPDAVRVEAVIVNGDTGSGAMPKNIVTGEDVAELGEYVAKVAGQ